MQYKDLASHFAKRAEKSDPEHVMWLNRNITKYQTTKEALSEKLALYFDTDSLKFWIINKMKEKFFTEPHLFIQKMQNPDKGTIAGYVIEHHYFLKQWVKSCALIMANTDNEKIQNYEIENIISEFHGTINIPSHHSLLLRMGESYGISQEYVYKSKPLKETENAINFWDKICRENSSLEGMAAMHTLELIANKNFKGYGARYTYFDPIILNNGSITNEAVDFLKEGYQADVLHSEEALDLIEEYIPESMVQSCQAISVKSMDYFSEYLYARVRRGEMLENK